MKDFNWFEFKKGKVAVNCDTEEKAMDFLNKCKEHELKQGDRFDLLHEYTFFNINRANLCYAYDHMNSGRIAYADIAFYKSRSYKIVEWEIDENMNKEFTKTDLKSGMVVEYRNGERRVIVGETLVGECYQNLLSYYSNDLKIMKSNELDATHDNLDNLDIVKVFKVQKGMYCMPQFLYQIPDSEVIWEREEPKKMTIEQIEKALGYKIEIED